MKILITLLTLAFSHAAVAQTTAPLAGVEAPAFLPIEATTVSPSDFIWKKRLVVVFADSPIDPRFEEQVAILLARPEVLIERDMVVIVDTDPAATSEWRMKLRPRGFAIVLIGKAGGIELRKPVPWNVRELTRIVDKMPLRLEEVRRAKQAD
ncbi:MAG: hypothetical protein ACI9IV_002114 [Paracoccaceae bacterium]|jgi:hypothetical protein